ncbi:GPI-GlcNAc transferase complex, PIG-H component-domain-containing protein [Podospora australis]|uniref:GPI-GlcNAc transferase complex, PIG-H component-domain-containing protein n=1 Tax=Podospora australis TaxID=1536484 RepID=A0AAN6WYE9_9PEZI|nr:GPI-GlcNAc transferase complex, PIG-H component-domain-containing protein [Podospora australis]
MLKTTTPHLYIRRPSPTTAEFTVTTLPPLTIPLRLLLLTITLLRLSTVLAATVTIYSRFSLLLPPSTSSSSQPSATTLLLQGDIPTLLTHLLTLAHFSAPGLFLSNITAPIPDKILLPFSSLAIYLALFLQLHTTESLLVLRGLGIQTSSGWSPPFGTSGSGETNTRTNWWKWVGRGGALWGWAPKTRFIPTEKIRDVLINEAFRGFEVRYYLIVVVEGEEDVVVVFPKLLPRKKIVEAVWRGVRGCLYEGDRDSVNTMGAGGGNGHQHAGHGHNSHQGQGNGGQQHQSDGKWDS